MGALHRNSEACLRPKAQVRAAIARSVAEDAKMPSRAQPYARQLHQDPLQHTHTVPRMTTPAMANLTGGGALQQSEARRGRLPQPIVLGLDPSSERQLRATCRGLSARGWPSRYLFACALLVHLNEGPALHTRGSVGLSVCTKRSYTNRDGGIRTRDPLNPIQVRYRAALRPVPPGQPTQPAR